ncbi:hypothetical protein GDO81_021904 [Engystomops pustulosus]|uniref:Secreted protein n=1 Tax=Engystomops pustulosus TaxID=76066 RepID=A0AAV6ZWJ6_ENGPU|nr:hypothetical protein GDO81_021904 [Engystomops pustulosus]
MASFCLVHTEQCARRRQCFNVNTLNPLGCLLAAQYAPAVNRARSDVCHLLLCLRFLCSRRTAECTNRKPDRMHRF